MSADRGCLSVFAGFFGAIFALLLLSILLIGACVLIVGGAFHAIDKAVIEERGKQSPASGEPAKGAQPTQPATSAAQPKKRDKLTLRNYYKIEMGMSEEEVLDILGNDCEEAGANRFGNIETRMLLWKRFLASATVVFQNGRVVQKNQVNLPAGNESDPPVSQERPKVATRDDEAIEPPLTPIIAAPEKPDPGTVHKEAPTPPKTAGGARFWKTNDGREWQATFVAMALDDVRLRAADGSIIHVRFRELSPDDQTVVRNELAKQRKPK